MAFALPTKRENIVALYACVRECGCVSWTPPVIELPLLWVYACNLHPHDKHYNLFGLIDFMQIDEIGFVRYISNCLFHCIHTVHND